MTSFAFHHFLPVLSLSPLCLQLLSPPTHFHFIASPSPRVLSSPPSRPCLSVWLVGLRSVHHGLVLLRVFDSHLLSFLSLTGLTARPKLDWTVTHKATDENKPPRPGSTFKIAALLNHAAPPPPYSRVLAHRRSGVHARSTIG